MAKDENKTGSRGGQLNNNNAEKWTEDVALELGNKLIDWMKFDENYWVKTFLLDNDLDNDTGNYLADKFESFSVLYKKAFEMQESKLVDNALKNKWNNATAIFVLKNKHGYKDKSEIDSNHKFDYDSFLNDIKPPIED